MMFLNTISSKLDMKTKVIFIENYSDKQINFVDTTIYLQDGKLEFDVYSKATDSHLYLLPGSTHPKENIEKIPYGVALRLRRICSKDETFNKRSQEYKQYFVNRDYNADKVEHHFNKVKLITGEESLKPAKRQRKNIIPLITRLDPRIPNLRFFILILTTKSFSIKRLCCRF